MMYLSEEDSLEICTFMLPLSRPHIKRHTELLLVVFYYPRSACLPDELCGGVIEQRVSLSASDVITQSTISYGQKVTL